MGLSYSKSVRFGALRFNFSSSGIGVSAGVPGFRIGTGPRGAHISGSVGGFRYRQSLGRGKRKQTSSKHVVPTPPLPTPTLDSEVSNNIISTVTHASADVLRLGSTTGDQLLDSLNQQSRMIAWWPLVPATLLIIAYVFGLQLKGLSDAILISLGVVGVLATAWAYHLDQLRRLTVLFFEPDANASSKFAALLDGAMFIQSVCKLRTVAQTSTYRDSRYQAGASSGLKLEAFASSIGQAPRIVSNIDIPMLRTGKLTLAFFPDRVLAFSGKSVGAIEYGELGINTESSPFIESEGVPADATVVGKTWRFVNKNGSPDRRFKNNHEIPICRYQYLRLESPRGLNVRVMGSKPSSFDQFASALSGLRAWSTTRN